MNSEGDQWIHLWTFQKNSRKFSVTGRLKLKLCIKYLFYWWAVLGLNQ